MWLHPTLKIQCVKILQDLGNPPAGDDMPSEDDDREIQLTLTNRFKVDVEEESEMQQLYAETKELVIPILRPCTITIFHPEA